MTFVQYSKSVGDSVTNGRGGLGMPAKSSKPLGRPRDMLMKLDQLHQYRCVCSNTFSTTYRSSPRHMYQVLLAISAVSASVVRNRGRVVCKPMAIDDLTARPQACHARAGLGGNKHDIDLLAEALGDISGKLTCLSTEGTGHNR